MSLPRLEVVRSPVVWAQAVAIRLAVFVDEQAVPFDEELDRLDAAAYHLLARLGDRPVGTGRLIVLGDAGIIGRMAVLRPARGCGVGTALLRALIAEAQRRALREVSLAAQLHARAFYAREGFVPGGAHFLDGGIWHQRMWLPMASPARRSRAGSDR